jgi:succinate dehydrogenase/fumarate reductase flavoprotein subunit
MVNSGCVVFGRVAGDSACAYSLAQLSSQRAADRIGAITNHLLETKVRIDPSSKNVNLEFSWADGAGQVQTQSSAPQAQAPAESKPAQEGDRTAAQLESEKLPEAKAKDKGGEYTLEEIAKHNKEDDCWVILEDNVLDVTK